MRKTYLTGNTALSERSDWEEKPYQKHIPGNMMRAIFSFGTPANHAKHRKDTESTNKHVKGGAPSPLENSPHNPSAENKPTPTTILANVVVVVVIVIVVVAHGYSE